MSALLAPAIVAAALLMLAGAQKVVDPTMAVGALRALRLPASPALVRAGAAFEVALGAIALSAGTAWAWWLVAASYGAFGAFVLAALRSGTMIGSCGCFGREETPPHRSHLILNGWLGVLSAGVALSGAESPVEAVRSHPADGILIVAMAGIAVALLHAAFVELPRTLQPFSEPTRRTRAPQS